MNTNVQQTLTLRRMKFEDIESVLALGKSGLTHVDLAVAEPEPRDDISLYIMSGLTYRDLAPTDPDSPLTMSFVAEISENVIGFLLAYVHLVGIPINRICIIHAIVVDPDYLGQGIGAQLIRQLRSKCKEEEIQIMRFLVPQHHRRLANYIGSLGFHQSNVINFDKLSWDRD